MNKSKEVREEVWCPNYKSEGQSKEQFPLLGNYVASGAQNPLNVRSSLWWEICKSRHEHRPEDSYLLQKYVKTPRNLYCKFYKLVGHDENHCQYYELMMEHTDDAYRMQEEEHRNEDNGHCISWGGYQGRGLGGGAGWGHGKIIFYNCDQPWHFASDCQNPTTECKYCKYFDHVIKECMVLMEKMKEKETSSQHIIYRWWLPKEEMMIPESILLREVELWLVMTK